MDSTINHTEEMERAYFEAWTACKLISPLIANMSFELFCYFIDKLEVKCD